MPEHRTATREEWVAARAELLQREKELTRMSDELARQRRELPWVPVEKEYALQTAEGSRTLGELFDGRSQLVVYHFMFGPHYEAGCPSCSSTADSFNGVLAHLNARVEVCDRINLLQHGEITFDKPSKETSVQELNDIVVAEYRKALQERQRT